MSHDRLAKIADSLCCGSLQRAYAPWVVERATSGTGFLPQTFWGWMGLKPASREYWALNNLMFMAALLVQFTLGMWIDLYVDIPRDHPGTGSTNFFASALHSVSWAILHGPLVLAIHAALGLGVLVHSIHNFSWNLRWGTPGSAWAAGIGGLFVWTAGFNGGAFLNYDNDVNSLLMALFFGGAMLCYAVVVFLLARAPEGRSPQAPTSVPLAR
jgi:hypothetical protein